MLALITIHLPPELCCLVSLMTYSRNALEPDKISPFFYQISFCAPSHRQFDPFGNSPTAPRFDRALVPTENQTITTGLIDVSRENFQLRLITIEKQ